MSTIREQARRRWSAARDLRPYNECGDLDPDEARRRDACRPMRPETALEVMRIGGIVPREQCRNLWLDHPVHRPMLEAYAQAHREGWAA